MEFEIGEFPDLFQNIYLLVYLYYSIKFLYIYLRPVLSMSVSHIFPNKCISKKMFLNRYGRYQLLDVLSHKWRVFL